MRLNKLGILAVVSAFMISLVGCGGSGFRTADQIKEDGKLYVATNAEFAPFEYKEGSNFVGIDMDIISLFATEHLGVECIIKDQDFDAALLSVSTNKTDIAIAAITANDKRRETLAFSDSYYTANQVVIVRTDSAYASLTTEAEILAALSANKATIGVQRGTTGQYYAEGDADWEFEGIANTKVQTYDNGGIATNALSNGQIDAVIIDAAPAQILASKFSNVKVLDVVLTEEEYAIAVAKGNDSLVAELNTFIASIKASGKFDEIVNKYYTE